MKFSTVRGTRDIFGQQVKTIRYIEEQAKKVFHLFRFQEIRTPIFEETALFTRSIGESTDIVEKEMYTFPDKKGRSLTLRPEGTAPVVRAYLQANLHRTEKITRLFYTGPMFRYERPQAGRYREFWQTGAEIFGSESHLVDAEIILMNSMILKHIGIDDFMLRINSVGCNECQGQYIQKLVQFAKAHISQLCENCNRRIKTNPLRILDCKKKECCEHLSNAPKLTDFLDDNCRSQLHRVVESLKKSGIPEDKLSIDATLVRGLDYYTGVVFECTSDKLGAQDAISAGGRYDTLVQSFGGPSIPAVGFAMGIDRLMSLLPQNILSEKTGKNIFIATMGDNARTAGFILANKLREHNLPTDIELHDRSLKAQLSFAAENKFSYVVIIGEDELEKGYYTLKNMRTKTQSTASSPEQLIKEIDAGSL